ncbi:MAG TPA: HAMP domain-containing sensor histidine kinase [Pseudonocardia sp.]
MTVSSGADSVLARRAALRLGLQATALVSAIVVLLSTASVLVVLSSQDAASKALLDAAVVRADDVGDPPAGVWLAEQRAGRSAATPGMPAGLPDRAALARVAAGGGPEFGEIRASGVDYRTETLRQPGGTTIQGVLDLTSTETMQDRLIMALIVCGAVGLLLAAVAGTVLGHRALRPLSATLALQRRFVADAGHELRTPVTLLNTRAQLLRRRLAPRSTVPAAALVDIDAVIADSARLGEILEDLLLASDPTAERIREPVDIAEIACVVLAAVGPDAEAKGVRLIGPAPGDAPVLVAGSPAALRRAVTALVDNAVRHAAREVAVTVRASDRVALLDVADDGPGIDPEVAPRLFERFASGRPVSSEGRRRYGLGLALVSEIAAAHDGQVQVLRPPAPGAALRLRLPALAAPPQ